MSNNFQATGSVVYVGPVQQVTDSFSKRDLVIEIEDGQHPQQVQFQAANDRAALLDSLAIGQTVTVHFNLRGTSYEKKDGSGKAWFTNLALWKIDHAAQAAAAPAAATTKYVAF